MSSTSTSTSTSTGKKDGGFFGEFIAGVFLICFALPMVWMNERKQVKVYNTIKKAREAVRTVDIDNPMDEDNYKLVHASGQLTTETNVIDERFNLVLPDTVKIKRVVEVL